MPINTKDFAELVRLATLGERIETLVKGVKVGAKPGPKPGGGKPGRPKGSKNKPKDGEVAQAPASNPDDLGSAADQTDDEE